MACGLSMPLHFNFDICSLCAHERVLRTRDRGMAFSFVGAMPPQAKVCGGPPVLPPMSRV